MRHSPSIIFDLIPEKWRQLSEIAQEYQLGEDFFSRLRRNMVLRGVFMAVLMLLFIVLVPLLSGFDETDSRELILSVVSELITSAVLVAIAAAVLIHRYRRTVEKFQNFRIVLFEQGLKRILPGQQDLYIAASEISRVITRPGHGTGVEGMKGQPALWIPVTLQGYEELMQTVNAWRTPELKSSFWANSMTQMFLTIVLVAGIAVTLFSTSPVLVMATGIPLAAYMGWSAFVLGRSPYTRTTLRRQTNAMWIVVVIIVLRVLSQVH